MAQTNNDIYFGDVEFPLIVKDFDNIAPFLGDLDIDTDSKVIYLCENRKCAMYKEMGGKVGDVN